MKTKYILHGGSALEDNEDNSNFFKEILSSDKKELKILIVPFAVDGKIYKLEIASN